MNLLIQVILALSAIGALWKIGYQASKIASELYDLNETQADAVQLAREGMKKSIEMANFAKAQAEKANAFMGDHVQPPDASLPPRSVDESPSATQTNHESNMLRIRKPAIITIKRLTRAAQDNLPAEGAEVCVTRNFQVTAGKYQFRELGTGRMISTDHLILSQPKAIYTSEDKRLGPEANLGCSVAFVGRVRKAPLTESECQRLRETEFGYMGFEPNPNGHSVIEFSRDGIHFA